MIALISDTHDNYKILPHLVAALKSLKPEAVIHSGDVTSPKVLDHLTGLKLHLAFGNNDYAKSELIAKGAALKMGDVAEELYLEIDGRSFLVNHGTDPGEIETAARSQNYDYVVHGHSHEPRDETLGKTRIINPGALFRAVRYTFATLEPASGELKFYELPKV